MDDAIKLFCNPHISHKCHICSDKICYKIHSVSYVLYIIYLVFIDDLSSAKPLSWPQPAGNAETHTQFEKTASRVIAEACFYKTCVADLFRTPCGLLGNAARIQWKPKKYLWRSIRRLCGIQRCKQALLHIHIILLTLNHLHLAQNGAFTKLIFCNFSLAIHTYTCIYSAHEFFMPR